MKALTVDTVAYVVANWNVGTDHTYQLSPHPLLHTGQSKFS